MQNIKKDTIIRTVVLILALVNNCLTMTGHSPLPIQDAQITEWLSLGFTIGAAGWAWWKNNSVTPEAIQADAIMHGLKDGTLELDYENKE